MEKKVSILSSAKKATENLSRRDVLKIGLLFAGTVAGRNVMKFFVGSEEVQMGFIPNPEQQESNEEKVEHSRHITTAFKKISTLVSLYKDPNPDLNLINFFLKKYGISSTELVELNRIDSQGIKIDDITTIFESLETSTLADSIKEKLTRNDKISYSTLTQFLIENGQNTDWVKFIEDNNLGATILSVGIKGKGALVNLGIPIDSYDFQESLVVLPQKREQLSPDYTINHYQDTASPHNSIININTPEKSSFYQYSLSLESEKLAPSEYIVSRLQVLDGDNTVLTKSQSKEFITLENWIYLEYKAAQLNTPDLTPAEFHKILHQKIRSNNQNNDGLQGVLSTIYLELENTYGTNRATDEMNQLIAGSPKVFKDIQKVLTPGAKGLLHTKKSHLLPTSTYQLILKDCNHGGHLDFKKIPENINKYSGNLYLQSIVDRRAVEGEILQSQLRGRSSEAGSVINSLLGDTKTIEDYASDFFGNRKVIITDENGAPKGTIVNGRVTEPVINVPTKLLDILDAVEGERWKNGKEYIKTILKRNVFSLFTDDPASGGSDRIMQLMEMIFPSPYDGLTSLSDEVGTQFPFRRPDLYGVNYLYNVLIPAVRDGLYVEKLYSPHNYISSKTLKSSSATNLLCAKLESYLLARDMTEKYGKERLDRLYVQFVPIGNASGIASGIQMQGLETGANYYFGGRSLDQLTSGELSILAGMIQSPINYGPVKWAKGGWTDNTSVCFERAEKVAYYCEQKKGFNKKVLVEEIRAANFRLSPKNSWVTTFTPDQLSSLKPGTLGGVGTKLDLGIQVLREPKSFEQIPKFPKIIELPNHANAEQEKGEIWFSSILDKDLLRLKTKENSEVSQVLNAVAVAMEDGLNNHDQMVLNLIDIAKSIDPGFNYQFWNGKINGEKTNLPDIRNPYQKGDAKYDLWNSLYELKSANYWQCGQCGLLMNSFLRLKTGHGVPTMLAPGNVKNWLGVLGSNSLGQVAREYLKLGDYEVISLDKKKKGQEFLVSNPIELFQVGDIVVSWKSKDYGHATVVIDKGVDSEGQQYVTVFDANYESTGKVRRQTIWAKDITRSMYPGRPLHMAIIRPANLSHGYQTNITEQDRNFVNKVYTANVAEEKVVLPVFEQTVIDQNNKKIKISNPGVAITSFNESGIVMSIDNTNMLGQLPVPAGNAIKPFVFAYALLKGIDPTKEVSIYPGYHSLDGSDTYITNSSAQGFNLQGVEGKATLEEALACSIDVPFQIVFKELMESDKNTWDEFQGFLQFFGIPLIDWQGNILESPTANGATGLDAQVPGLDQLGFALNCLMNPENLLADQNINPSVISAFQKTRDILLNQNIRNKIMINDDNPIIEDVGDDLTSPSMTSGTNQVELQGEKFLWQGTNLSDTFQGLAIRATATGCEVTISIAKGQIIKGNVSQSFNLNSLNYHSSILGHPGLALTTTKAATLI